MKKALIAILAVATMAFVIGCGSGDNADQNATPPAPKADKAAAPAAGGATAGAAPAATAGGAGTTTTG